VAHILIFVRSLNTMETETVTQSSSATLQINGKAADVRQHASLAKFSQNVPQSQYDRAVELIKKKISDMSQVGARFSLNLAPNHAPLLIDARTSPAMLEIVSDDLPQDLDAQVYITAVMIKRFSDGLMDARYALNWGHIFMLSGPTRVGVKFVDALTPFNAVHPKLDRLDLRDLPKLTEDIEQVQRDLDTWGYGFVKNALTPEEVGVLKKRLMDQAQGEADAGIGFFDGGENKPNQRVWCLPNKGKEFIDLLEHNKTIDAVVPDFLGNEAILFSYTANIARPGNTPMHMHTDQITIQPPIRSVAVGMNLMYFLEDITAENGGTLVMPGSHKGNWAPDDPYDPVDTIAAAGPAGTCMVFESRLWHATGPNRIPGSERPVILVFFTRPWMRQQENYSLSIKDDVLETCSDKVKGYFGFRTTGSIGGVQTKRRDGDIVRRPKEDEYIGVMGVGSSKYKL
jgi:ectoine hydroxylase-related dioxygenase (phytanoyl-CoA dioxygenase family)